jgi:two-component system alkaline phosphatase synthesis response regulator PhoP
MPKRILIVDDEPNIVVPLEFLMKQSGYDVSIARTGKEALNLALENKTDLILLDIMLPDMTGFEVCHTLRVDYDMTDVKIILLTAKSRESDIKKGMDMGADAYIIKPFSTKDLVKKIDEMI